MKEELQIVLIQEDLQWEDKSANLKLIENRLNQIRSSDIIVLPEMFSTGFSMNVNELAEEMSGPTVVWMKDKARELNAIIVGSLIIEERGQFYNRLIWAEPQGEIHHYSKRHLFSFAGEDEHYTAGSERLIIERDGWKFCPLVCYDLRFPVWSRNQKLDGSSIDFEYDVLIYIANWPSARSKPWINLLEARAHENQAFVVGVNRVGTDGNGIDYSGGSSLFSPKGELMSDFGPSETGIRTISIRKSKLDDFRAKFRAWKDKDTFTVL